MRVYCYVVIKQAIREKALGNRVKIGEKKNSEKHIWRANGKIGRMKDDYIIHTRPFPFILFMLCVTKVK